jgi:hypothetical protein
MKDEFLKKGKQALRSIRLPAKKREAVFAHLQQYMEQRPPAMTSPSTVSAILVRYYRTVFEFRYSYVMAGVLVAIFVGGTAVAAQDSLPGDFLYQVKIHINEPLQGALALSDVAKARWEVQKTLRRLGEAESLAAEGRLDQGHLETIKENVDKSLDDFNAIVESSGASGPSQDLINARADLEASMSAHAGILSNVENNLGGTGNGNSILNSSAKKDAVQKTTDNSKGAIRRSQDTEATEDRKGKQNGENDGEKDQSGKSPDPAVQSVNTERSNTENGPRSAVAATSTGITPERGTKGGKVEKEDRQQATRKSNSQTTATTSARERDNSGKKSKSKSD